MNITLLVVAIPLLEKQKVNTLLLKSHKTPYEKKIVLFNCLKDIGIRELKLEQKEMINQLIQGRLYAEIAKQSMKGYKKLTVKEHSDSEKEDKK